MDRAEIRAVALRVAALALLLLLALFAAIAVRTLTRIPDATLYLIRSEGATFTLEPVARRLGSRSPDQLAVAAVAALAEGPTDAEAARGLHSAVPEATRALDARVVAGALEVELSPDFAEGGGTASMRGRLEQVRWTLSQPAAVDAVALRMDGAPLETLGGEGILVESEWSRPRSDLLPRW